MKPVQAICFGAGLAWLGTIFANMSPVWPKRNLVSIVLALLCTAFLMWRFCGVKFLGPRQSGFLAIGLVSVPVLWLSRIDAGDYVGAYLILIFAVPYFEIFVIQDLDD